MVDSEVVHGSLITHFTSYELTKIIHHRNVNKRHIGVYNHHTCTAFDNRCSLYRLRKNGNCTF